ncbi:hypothetical protein OIV83_005644 [Microbotryomycetes sp. JL201]|nr:hypothetical protein OIV83_005644 [Microbotryomycetes sp. JL201]
MPAILDDKESTPSGSEQSSLRNNDRRRRRGLSCWLVTVVAVLVMLAVALGVGLGVGMKRARHASTSQQTNVFVLKGAQAMSDEPAQDRIYIFVLEERFGAPDGYNRSMLMVNGTYPGPTIEVNEDDRVIVKVVNLMPNSTAIHWHGLYQRGTPYFDGTNGITQCGIPPGESLVYSFTLDGWSGTTWWHAHHGAQYTDGLSGAIVVHPRIKGPAVDGEVVLSLADGYHRSAADLVRQYLSLQGMTGEGLAGVSQGNEPVPDSGTINGIGQWGTGSQKYFQYDVESNKTYRLRLINSGSFAAIRFSIDNHTLTVIEADGTLVEPYEVSGLTIQVAQRYSVLVTANQQGSAYWMRSVIQQDAFTYTEAGFNGNQLAVLRYGVDRTVMPDSSLVDTDPGPGQTGLSDMDTSDLVPLDESYPPNSTVSYTLTVSMQNTADNRWLSFVNSTSWSPLQGQATLFQQSSMFTAGAGVYDKDSQFVISVPQEGIVDIVVNNYDDGDHPFHLHGHKFWIMGQGAGRYQAQALNSTNPMRRDTVLLPAYTWTVLRFKADNLWHMAAGLLMQFSTLASSVPAPPSIMLDQCNSPANLVPE